MSLLRKWSPRVSAGSLPDKDNQTRPDTTDMADDADTPPANDDSPLSLDDKLNLETGQIAWSELVRHFARGVVIKVLEGRDLVEVANCLARDDTNQLKLWLEDKSVARASDDDARDWTAREPVFWCVVTAPWVLVQEHNKTNPTVH